MKAKSVFTLAVALAALLAAAPPLQASQTDDRIESSAAKSYVFRTLLKDDRIDVDSREGVVTLSGSVSESSHKALAEETVEALPGVKQVENRLAVVEEPSARGSDAWVLAKVKAALLYHKEVSGLHTDVDVRDGIVTLRGNAESAAQKELTGEYVKDIEGVKGVRNEMSVASNPEAVTSRLTENIDDASITAQVKMALLTHRSTSALRTDVDTDDGVVTLHGKARNPAEKELVTQLVDDVKGVKDVRNEMTVERSK